MFHDSTPLSVLGAPSKTYTVIHQHVLPEKGLPRPKNVPFTGPVDPVRAAKLARRRKARHAAKDARRGELTYGIEIDSAAITEALRTVDFRKAGRGA